MISIIHPSRNRPEMAYETCKKWINLMTGKNDFEYILSIDEDEPKIDMYENFSKNLPISLLKRFNKSAIEAINESAKKTKFNIIIVVSDDFDCFPGWDEWLVNNLKDKEDYLVKTSDGLQPRLITLPIMDRKYYERFGYIYYPEYKHLFCDTEMTDVGHILGRVIDLQDVNHQFLHKHYTAGFMQKDSINEKNDATWSQGENLYNSRKLNNFFL